MRLRSLDLIRYGKFSQLRLDFPRAAHDFHLIVGANEAGKSTLRRAVAELLFGMPLRSPMDFRHPIADLRLGAVIESEAGALAFERARGRKPLRRPDDDGELPAAALAEHLGATGEALYTRMFCLDLAALLEGGRTLLDAADDVGQLLFQSAAGISGLGALRDALEQEAGKLYAPRRAADRAFYQALDNLDAARLALKGATVQTRSWTDATRRLEDAQAALDALAARHAVLKGERTQLERIRRIAPRAAAWRDAQEALSALAPDPGFPADAQVRLADAELARAGQGATLALHRDEAQRLQARRDALAPDAVALALAGRIEALAAQAQEAAAYPRELARCRDEIATLLQQAGEDAAQLGWPADEAGWRARLPAPLALKALDGVLAEHGRHALALQGAQQQHDEHQARIAGLEARQAAPAQPAPAAGLAAALQEAQALRPSAARQRGLQREIDGARAHYDAALQALAQAAGARGLAPPRWQRDPAVLAALPLPRDERLAGWRDERAQGRARLDAALDQQATAQEEARVAALDLAQFSAGHDVVTQAEVLQARAARDALWARIKSQDEGLDAAAPRLDRAIDEADRRVDRQRDQAGEAATLTRLRQAAERAEALVASRGHQVDTARQALADFDRRWAAQASAAGLPGMALDELPAWAAQRRVALDAAADQAAQASALRQEAEAEAAALAGLRAALQASGAETSGLSTLATLCDAAQQHLDAHRRHQAAAESLQGQLAEGRIETARLAQSLKERGEAQAQWQRRWTEALARASLDGPWATPDAAPAAIETLQALLDRGARIDDIRQRRVRTMEQALAELRDSAGALQALGTADAGPAPVGARGPDATAAAAAPGPAAPPDPFEIQRALSQRLQAARDTARECERIDAELRRSRAQALEAEAALAATAASLASLHQLGATEDAEALRRLIAASDRRRRWEAESQQHRQAVLDAGDGLGFDALLAEVAQTPPDAAMQRLDALDAEAKAAEDEREALAEARSQARAELARVQGGADAARAESRRREALAQLGDAAERYLSVATAGRLLRWAIDRYRERKQGPLLQRASALFAQLTLGGFERLAPDYESTPPKLIALRAGGERVGVEGLSEGTRDQLFLALRLAALELHIEADRPLPFIADDLFVNFHDSRSRAGLAALGELSRRTQVIFLTHHEHLAEVAREVIGEGLNVIELGRD